MRMGGADLVPQEREDRLVLGPAASVDRGKALPHAQRVGPLVLLLVQLLEVDEGVPVFRVELQDFLKRFNRAIDEARVTEIEAKAEQHIGNSGRARYAMPARGSSSPLKELARRRGKRHSGRGTTTDEVMQYSRSRGRSRPCSSVPLEASTQRG